MNLDWISIGKKIGSLGCSLLGTVLAGPAGGSIGTLLGNQLFGDKSEEVSEDQFIQTLANPDAIIKMKQFELDHKLELEKLILESQRIELQDRADARRRQIEHEKVTGKSDVNLYVLAWTIVIGFFILVSILIFIPLPTDSNGVIFLLFGTLSAGFGSVMGYFFGSSKSSSDKTDMIYKSTPVK